MAEVSPETFIALLPALRQARGHLVRSSYDEEADVLYVTFGDEEPATDSEMTEDGVIVRYKGNEVIGFTVLDASLRS